MINLQKLFLGFYYHCSFEQSFEKNHFEQKKFQESGCVELKRTRLELSSNRLKLELEGPGLNFSSITR